MGWTDLFQRKDSKNGATDEVMRAQAKRVMFELLSLGSQIDGIIVVVSIDRVPRVMAGGIDDPYQAMGILDHAKYEISRKGLPIYD